MALPEGYRLTAMDDASRRDELLRLFTWVFPSAGTVEDLNSTSPPIPWGRMWGVEPPGYPSAAAGDLAGMSGAYGLRAFPVPGAETSCGWLTWVGVHPGHRRRGILREMIANHFADCLRRGEAISALTATEGAIYGRFGYGAASQQLALTMPRGARLRPVADADRLSVEVAVWDAAQHGDVVAELHRAYAAVPGGIGRPGWVTWETPELRARSDSDAPALRGGLEAQRLVIVRDESGQARAYARFRRQLAWKQSNPDGELAVRDAVALDARSAHRLWSTLLDADLMARVTIRPIPTDDPILSLLVDPRQAQPAVSDLEWVRILDLPKALADRRYAASVDVVLDVTDAEIPANAGRWRVRADAWGHAKVEQTDADADLTLDIRELGAAHLGSVSFTALAQAGQVAARDGAVLARASAAWSWPVAAGANWVF